MQHRSLAVVCLCAALSAPLASAQSVVVPNALATVRTLNGLNTLLRDSGQARAYMLGIAASQLAGIPIGAPIQGVSFRSWVGVQAATWPPSNVTWSSYEIDIGSAIPLASWTGTFATNFSAPPTRVRNGALLITANTYTNNTALPAPTPNAWGEFYFDFQVPYIYTGGDLAIYCTHPGSSIVGAFFLESDTSNPATGLVAFSATGFRATVGATNTACTARVHYGYGAGCAGASGSAPNLVLSGNTTGGGTVFLSVGNGPASQPGTFLFGLGRTQIPIVGACNLLTIPAITSPFGLDANGRFQFSQVIAPGILGTVDAQAAVIDPGSATTVTFSNAIEYTAS